MRSPCSPDNGDRLRKPPFKFHRGLSLTLLLLADLILVVTIVRHNNTRHRVLLALPHFALQARVSGYLPISFGRPRRIAVTACYSKTMPNQ